MVAITGVSSVHKHNTAAIKESPVSSLDTQSWSPVRVHEAQIVSAIRNEKPSPYDEQPPR